MESNQKVVQALIQDVFKEFKASGNFDRLRKEYFAEITSQVFIKASKIYSPFKPYKIKC